uniref:Myb-like domain-containing protein n=1 Tax=Chaetoceros debilis TaxID=122233 RepID=A0A7S3Q582_9STRA
MSDESDNQPSAAGIIPAPQAQQPSRGGSHQNQANTHTHTHIHSMNPPPPLPPLPPPITSNINTAQTHMNNHNRHVSWPPEEFNPPRPVSVAERAAAASSSDDFNPPRPVRVPPQPRGTTPGPGRTPVTGITTKIEISDSGTSLSSSTSSSTPINTMVHPHPPGTYLSYIAQQNTNTNSISRMIPPPQSTPPKIPTTNLNVRGNPMIKRSFGHAGMTRPSNTVGPGTTCITTMNKRMRTSPHPRAVAVAVAGRNRPNVSATDAAGPPPITTQPQPQAPPRLKTEGKDGVFVTNNAFANPSTAIPAASASAASGVSVSVGVTNNAVVQKAVVKTNAGNSAGVVTTRKGYVQIARPGAGAGTGSNEAVYMGSRQEKGQAPAPAPSPGQGYASTRSVRQGPIPIPIHIQPGPYPQGGQGHYQPVPGGPYERNYYPAGPPGPGPGNQMQMPPPNQRGNGRRGKQAANANKGTRSNPPHPPISQPNPNPSLLSSSTDIYDVMLGEISDLLMAAQQTQTLGRLKMASTYQLLVHARLVGLGKRFDRFLAHGETGVGSSTNVMVGNGKGKGRALQFPPTAVATAAAAPSAKSVPAKAQPGVGAEAALPQAQGPPNTALTAVPGVGVGKGAVPGPHPPLPPYFYNNQQHPSPYQPASVPPNPPTAIATTPTNTAPTNPPTTITSDAKQILAKVLPHDVDLDDTMMEHLARAAMELHNQRTGRGMLADKTEAKKNIGMGISAVHASGIIGLTAVEHTKGSANASGTGTGTGASATGVAWKESEEQLFVQAVQKYGRDLRNYKVVNDIVKCVGTRSESEVRAHLKNFKERERRERNLDGTAAAGITASSACTASDGGIVVAAGMNVGVGAEGVTMADTSASASGTNGAVGEIHPTVGEPRSGSTPLPVPGNDGVTSSATTGVGSVILNTAGSGDDTEEGGSQSQVKEKQRRGRGRKPPSRAMLTVPVLTFDAKRMVSGFSLDA